MTAVDRMNEQNMENANLFLEHRARQETAILNLALISKYLSFDGFTYLAELLS